MKGCAEGRSPLAGCVRVSLTIQTIFSYFFLGGARATYPPHYRHPLRGRALRAGLAVSASPTPPPQAPTQGCRRPSTTPERPRTAAQAVSRKASAGIRSPFAEKGCAEGHSPFAGCVRVSLTIQTIFSYFFFGPVWRPPLPPTAAPRPGRALRAGLAASASPTPLPQAPEQGCRRPRTTPGCPRTAARAVWKTVSAFSCSRITETGCAEGRNPITGYHRVSRIPLDTQRWLSSVEGVCRWA